jgi:hypothetical protein
MRAMPSRVYVPCEAHGFVHSQSSRLEPCYHYIVITQNVFSKYINNIYIDLLLSN